MNCKVVGKEHPKCKTTSAEANPIFLEVKSPGTRDLIGRQNTGLGTCSRLLVEPHSPDVDVSSGNDDGDRPCDHEASRGFGSRGSGAAFIHLSWSSPLLRS